MEWQGQDPQGLGELVPAGFGDQIGGLAIQYQGDAGPGVTVYSGAKTQVYPTTRIYLGVFDDEAPGGGAFLVGGIHRCPRIPAPWVNGWYPLQSVCTRTKGVDFGKGPASLFLLQGFPKT